MRAVIIVEAGFQDEEFVYPYYRMLEEGWAVAVATPDGRDRFGKFGVPARATSPILGCTGDLLVVPGGFESPDRLRARQDVKDLVRGMHEAGKLIAAICHGPWVLISAGLLRGRLVTGYDSIWDDLANAGAVVTRSSVTTDGNLITARHYRDNGPFMQAVIDAVKQRSWKGDGCNV